MRRTATLPALVLALATVALAPPAAAGGQPFTTTLTGAAEAPTPGDPDGTGTAHLTLNQGTGEVCWDITTAGIDPVLAAHIHRAPVGEPGPVVVPLSDGSGCTVADPALVREIRKHPAEFYVNVHNATYPAGALRGQLG